MDASTFLAGLPWWTVLVVVGGVLAIVHFSVKFLYKYVYPKAVAKGNRWTALCIEALYRPFQAYLWFSAATVLVSLYARTYFDIGVITWITNLLRVGAIFSAIFGAYIFASGIKEFIAEKRHFDLTVSNFLSTAIFLITGVAALLMVLPILGFQIGGILAFGGMSGIIAGFAAKDAISNIFGGFLIAMDKPFKIGDWIHSLDRSIEGHVEHVGWRLTRIRSFDKCPIFIPNSLFSSMCFVNGSQMTNRRIVSKFVIRYVDEPQLKPILKALSEYVVQSHLIDQNQVNVVSFYEPGNAGLEIFVRIFTKATEFSAFHRAKERIFLDFLDIIAKHGAEIAYPTTDIRLFQESGK
jgi:MscS family membrane protein